MTRKPTGPLLLAINAKGSSRKTSTGLRLLLVLRTIPVASSFLPASFSVLILPAQNVSPS